VVTLEQRHYERLLDFRTGLRRFLRWSADQAATAGVTPTQHQLLLAIRGHPGPAGPTIREMAGYLLVRHHSAVEVVERAGAAGLVERPQDADDVRAVRQSRTANGADRLARLSALHLEELRRFAPQLEARWDGLDMSL
jgi:DNA-binding MarR family transcriptional regulator